MDLNSVSANVAGQKDAQQPLAETAGSIASAKTNTGSILFEKKEDEAVETTGSIASAQGLDGQASTSTAGNSFSTTA